MAVPSIDMKHLFLTGAKGAGKSTRLREITQNLPGTPTGFTTVKSDAVFGKPAVHLLRPGEAPAVENFLFFCGESADPARFDALGVAALRRLGDYILMDELGPAEADAHAFQRPFWPLWTATCPYTGCCKRRILPFCGRWPPTPRWRS